MELKNRKFQRLSYIIGAMNFLLGIMFVLLSYYLTLTLELDESMNKSVQGITICGGVLIAAGVAVLIWGYGLGVKADMLKIEIEKARKGT
jgi:hypothetical protein